MRNYKEFLDAKITFDAGCGFEVDGSEIQPLCKPHQREIIRWAVKGGRRAIFAAFGLGKSFMQLETLRLVRERSDGGRALVVCPLGVRQEFKRDAEKLGLSTRFIRSIDEVDAKGQVYVEGESEPIYITNYETVRDGKLDPKHFEAVSLDEADVLRGFGGSKTFREFMRLFEGVRFKFVATATPSPNEYIELLAYAAFLEIMDVSQAKTRFFKRNSEKADSLTIHPHKEHEFWVWVASWAVVLQRPSDMGFSDEGYELPPLEVRWHEIESDHRTAGSDRQGQARMFADAALGVVEASREKRDSLEPRIAKLLEIRAEEPDAHRIIWHDLEAERHAIEKAIPDAVSVYGSQDLEEREQAIVDFSDGKFAELSAKPVIAGSGCNFQRHCSRAVFLGIGFKFKDFIQAIHRIQRFLQTERVRIDIIYTEAERQIRAQLEEKWEAHVELGRRMTEIIREHGLSHADLARALKRSVGVERVEEKGKAFTLVNNDCVDETERMESSSVGLILTSIPFSTQYEYSPNYADFGHTDDNAHFFEQMDFLTPNLLRVLKPGRIAAVHVKDRIVPGGMTGLGFQTVYPFHAKCIEHYQRHGFAYMGMKTIVTDVVRENNQTYRLGWTEQCKDGTKMGCGMPEYLLLFRKPPTSNEKSYADEPVVKSKEQYSRGRWQLDAHGFMRSSGNRPLQAEDLEGITHSDIFKLFKKYSLTQVYNYEQHVALCEALDARRMLPVTFMLLQPQSWQDDVWSEITRMRTLNGAQHAKGREMHLCLARGSLVLTRRGHVPIEDVRCGDFVLTHLGRWRRVLIARKTGIREVIDLRAQGVAGLRLTPDHNVWARKSNWARQRDGAARSTPSWIEASETVDGGYVNLKLPPVEPTALSDRDCWLLGRWLADGHVGTRGDFWVSVGREKVEAFLEHAGRHAGTRGEGTAMQYRLKGLSSALKSALAACGRGAECKRVPLEILAAPADKARAVLEGYLSGDGHLVHGRDRWMATSVSRALLLGVAMLAQRQGSVASLVAGRAPGTSIIQGRTVQTQQEWVLSFDAPLEGRRKSQFILDDGAWKKVRTAEPCGPAEVWCLKVEEDESFTAEGCVVRNCPMQFDIADRVIEQFSMAGELVLDPFAGLGTVPYRAVLKGRRGYGVELSSKYFLDALTYCRAAEQKLATPDLFALVDAMEDEDVEQVEEISKVTA